MYNNNPDWSTIKEDNFAPIPEGWYNFLIVSCQVMSKGINGKFPKGAMTMEQNTDWTEFKLQLIDEGVYKGRVIFDNLYLWHENETPRNIACGRMKKINRINGLDPSKDKCSAHNGKIIMAKIKRTLKDENNPDGDVWTNIQDYKESLIEREAREAEQGAHGDQYAHHETSYATTATNNDPAAEEDDDIPF
jgi:hypothetical protein